MAYFFRLIVAPLLLCCSYAWSAVPMIPASTQYSVQAYGKDSGWQDTLALACSGVYGASQVIDYASYTVMSSVPRGSQQCTLTVAYRTPNVQKDNEEIKTAATRSVPAACPANSVRVPGTDTCDCAAGFMQLKGQCVPKKSEVCGSLQGMGTGLSSMDSDFGTQSAKWAGSKIGKSANSCLAGCQVSGSVDSCVVGTGSSSSTVCYLSSTSFTGDACTNSTDGGGGGTEDPSGADKDKPTDCPVGYEPSKYAPGVCIPKPNDCPSGSSPSKYAEGVCIPDVKGDDGSCEDPKDPTKRAECEGSKNKCPSGQVQSTTQVGTCVPGTDSTGKDKGGNKVECKDGKCTITKPDGSKEDKDKKSVCGENPDLPACKENKSTFGGSCMGGFSCEGDALQCAIAKEQHRRNCELFEKDTDSNSLTNKALNGTDDKSADALKASAAQLNVTSSFDQSGLGWSHSCPADPRIPLGFGGSNSEFTIPFSRICGPLSVLSLAGVGITLLGCGVWVLGGKKGG